MKWRRKKEKYYDDLECKRIKIRRHTIKGKNNDQKERVQVTRNDFLSKIQVNC